MPNFFSQIVDLLFPMTCVGCNRNGTLLCAACIDRLTPATDSAHAFAHSVFDYKNPLIRHAIWKFKYKHARGFAKVFAPYLYDNLIGLLSDELFLSQHDKIILTPIPLHKNRLRQRGYNQSELLVEEIMKLDTARIFSCDQGILTRIKDTNPQAKSEKKKARLGNLSGAFVADSSLARGKDIILIDDVTTTGATLSEARKALRSAGARSVRACTIAH